MRLTADEIRLWQNEKQIISKENKMDNSFRDFFKNNIDFLFILDMEGNIIEINDAVTKILGYSSEDLIGKNVLLVHPPEFRAQAKITVLDMITGKAASCPLPLLAKDDSYVPVETRVYKGIWNSKEALIGVSRNMTDLKLSEEKFSKVFNFAPVLMAISTHSSGVLIDVNQQFLKSTGYTKDEVIGKTSKDLNLFHDYWQRQKALELIAKKGEIRNLEVSVKTKSGELMDCLFSMDNIKIQTHEFLLTSAIDITSIKQAENKISQLFKKQKMMADILMLLNGSTNVDYAIQNILNLILQQNEYSRVYIVQDSPDIDLDPTIMEAYNLRTSGQTKNLLKLNTVATDEWKEKLMKEGVICYKDITALPPDFSKLLRQRGAKSVAYFPLHIQNTYLGYLGIDISNPLIEFTDSELIFDKTITNVLSSALERKNDIQKIKDSELRLKLAIESAREGIWDWNNVTGHVYFSDTWCKMLEYGTGDIKPHVSSWAKLVHPDDLQSVNAELSKHLKGETEYYETVHRILTKSGKWKWILDHGRVVERNHKDQPLRTMGTHIDITDQKHTEELLIEALSTKDKLMSIISHDLRGPISNLLPTLELLTDGVKLEEGKRAKYMLSLKSSALGTMELLDNLMTWSIEQADAIQLTPEPIKISDLIDECVAQTAHMQFQKSITIELRSPKAVKVFADQETTKIVLRNLLSNALKFSPSKDTIIISVRNCGAYAEIEFADNGPGMYKDEIENLFKLVPADEGAQRSSKIGTGLGLYLSKEFTEKNGGKIHVKSEPGKGSKFTFSLPVANSSTSQLSHHISLHRSHNHFQ
ncbi:MAG: PAS domain S-box protein [Bacteroidota bacterium]